MHDIGRYVPWYNAFERVGMGIFAAAMLLVIVVIAIARSFS